VTRHVDIRPAVPADRATVEDLLVRSWHATWAPHLPAEAAQRFAREAPVARYLDTALPALELAVDSGRVLGVLHREADELVTLEVEPGFKRRGIGRRLLAHAEAAGARTLEVRAFNLDAIAFYERRGWRRVAAFEATELGVPALTYTYHRPG